MITPLIPWVCLLNAISCLAWLVFATLRVGDGRTTGLRLMLWLLALGGSAAMALALAFAAGRIWP